VLLNLYLLRLGYGPELVGLVNAAGLLAFGVGPLPAIALGSRWGSRRTMIAGLSTIMVGNLLLPLAEFIPPGARAGWLMATNIVANFGLALYVVNINPFLMHATGLAERNHVFAVQAALWPLAGAAGSVVGGLLPALFADMLAVSIDHPLPYRYPLIISALLMSSGVWAMARTTEPVSTDSQPSTAPAGAAPIGLIGFLTLIVLLTVAGEGLARTFFNVYLDDELRVSTSRIGMLTATAQLLAVPAALITPLLAAAWGHARTYTVAAFGMFLCLLPLALIPHWSAAGLGFMGLIALASISRPTMMVYQMVIVSPRWRIAMAGATTMAVGLSWSLMALGGGYLIAALGYPSLFSIGAALTLAGAGLFWLRNRRRRAGAASALGTTG
jgi:MFS family permease